MTKFIPLNLSASNLGKRHRHLNSLVSDAFQSSVPFEYIENIPEASPVDRLFKIYLASKYRNVDYIIKNLKEPDMLFVSKAMKSIWLFESEYKDIINANYLENELFPEMTTTAINKTLHWIQHNLRDSERCKDFYMYYKEKQFKIAMKFLWHCSNAYILEEFKNIIDKTDAFNLKVLSEKCPELSKIFYVNLEINRDILKRYLDNERSFFCNIKYVLKSDPDSFFYVIEKYFNVHRFKAFGPDVTKHIMINHRYKFFEKSELYTGWLLDIKTIAKYLSQEEVKEVVLKLARAEFMTDWFTYQKVEPLINRIDKDERAIFKKLVFDDKAIGDKIKDWPYTPPSSPVIKEIPGYSLFLDQEYGVLKRKYPKRLIKRGGCMDKRKRSMKRKTPLDDLFDRYRFMGFDATLSELRKRIRAEGNMQMREYMMLVLVSKSGGREDCLRMFMKLLPQYRNEPVHFRAAIVRSLVKRAFAWRLPDDLWSDLLQWAHGMGLDGSPSEINCTEGLHAVVLRNFLSNDTVDPVVSKIFLDNFTYFNEYSLTAAESNSLRKRLPNLLLASAISETGFEKETRLGQLLGLLGEYKIPFDRFPGVIEAIATAAREDPGSFDYIIIRLFDARVARKRFFKVTFSLIQNNASYMNALRHDISVINVHKGGQIKDIDYEGLSSFEPYFRKLVIYFAEPGGLAEQFYAFLKPLTEMRPHKALGKSLSLLARNDWTILLKSLQSAPKKSKEKSLAAALTANAHNARPRIELNISGWQAVGVKAIANLVSTSPRSQREDIVKDLIASGRRTLRLALASTENEDARCSAYRKMVELRPGAALKIFLRYLKRGNFGSGFETIWNTVKPLITELDITKRERLCKNLEDDKFVPGSIKPEYYVLLHQAFVKFDKYAADRMISRMENIINEINETYFSSIVTDIVLVELLKYCHYHRKQQSVYFRLIAKYLLLCDSEEIQRDRLNSLEEHFFQRFEVWWKGIMDKTKSNILLEEFLEALKYNKVFFNAKYVSCMPVFERVLAWMHSMLPIERWFNLYIKIHLTMLYYKASRICINQKPEFFNGEPKNLDKGIDMFGAIFGKLIARDYEESQAKNFQSIREIYRTELMAYLMTCIEYSKFDYSKERFVVAVIKSMLEENGASEAHILASYIFVDHEKSYFKYGIDLSRVKNIVKTSNNDELRFCLQIESEN